jgi:CO/xanthine dehydrogenase Mo-binding subunit
MVEPEVCSKQWHEVGMLAATAALRRPAAITFEEVPPIDIVLIDRPREPFLGTGEAAQGPTAASLGNAVFDATGVRFRRIPFTPKRIFGGLAA